MKGFKIMVNAQLLQEAKKHGLRKTEITVSIPIQHIMNHDKETINLIIETHIENKYKPRYLKPTWEIWGFDIDAIHNYDGMLKEYQGDSVTLLRLTLEIKLHRYVLGPFPENDYVDDTGIKYVHCKTGEHIFLLDDNWLENLDIDEEVIRIPVTCHKCKFEAYQIWLQSELYKDRETDKTLE